LHKIVEYRKQVLEEHMDVHLTPENRVDALEDEGAATAEDMVVVDVVITDVVSSIRVRKNGLT
jgi:hypothetical protein